MHKFSMGLVARSAAIFVGNVSAGAMVKTRMAKSTLDAGLNIAARGHARLAGGIPVL